MTATTFSSLELDESLLTALEEKGYQRPTAIQADAIPAAMDGRDILGSAPTGTGKTAAFLLPAIQHLLDYPRKKSPATYSYPDTNSRTCYASCRAGKRIMCAYTFRYRHYHGRCCLYESR